MHSRLHQRASLVTATRCATLGVMVVSLGLACRPPASVASASRDVPLTVMSYNIRHGRGMDGRVDLERTARVLRAHAPDFVGLQEVDHRVTRSGGVAEADSLGTLLGMHAAFGGFLDYQGGRYGMAILSRRPIASVHPIALPDGNEPRIALLVRVELADGDTIAVVNVHFDWVDNDSFRFAQATALTRVLDTLRVPYLLLGDFNDTPGSRTLALFAARASEIAKPRDAHFTFPSDAPVKEIDFLFAAPAAAWRFTTARVVDERMASDHRPLMARIQRAMSR